MTPTSRRRRRLTRATVSGLGAVSAEPVHGPSHVPGPARLVAGPDPGAVVAVEVLLEVIPGVAAGAIVLAHRAPLSLREVGPPLLPRRRRLVRVHARTSALRRERASPFGRWLLLRRLVERDGERLRVGDLDQVSDLDQIEVLRVLRLDGLRVAPGPLDRDRLGLLVDRRDRGRDGDLPADRAGRRLA